MCWYEALTGPPDLYPYMSYVTHTAIVLFPVLYRLPYVLLHSYSYCTVPCSIQASVWVTSLVQLLHCCLVYTGSCMSYLTHTSIALLSVLYRLLYELRSLIQLLYCSLFYTGFCMSYLTRTAIALLSSSIQVPVWITSLTQLYSTVVCSIRRLLYELRHSYSYCTVPCSIQASDKSYKT